MGLLRFGFGKTVTVEKISGGSNKNIFTESVYSSGAKIAAVALFILALPVTIFLAGIGCVGMSYSKSHGQLLNAYNESKRPVVNQVDNKTDQQKTIPVIRLNTVEDRAATSIQKHFRGYLARKSHLPSNLYPHYRVQCDRTNGGESHSLPQAKGGKTKVYLPREMPGVVLKNSGRRNAITRFHQMQGVRSILNSQNSSHLIIPKANLCKEFLVEQRLPINVNSYHNMGLYLSQTGLFDEAVRELTRLFSRVYLGDLVSYQHNPLGHIAGVEDFVRYDNLPLYVVEENGKKEGKIGLIDLEHVQKGPYFGGLETIARIFPLHLDLIKNEASKLKMKVNEGALDASAEKGRKYLQVGFSDHLQWLKQKGVSTKISSGKIPSESFQVDSQRIEELTSLLEKELLKLNQGVNDLFTRNKVLDKPQKDFLTENPEEMAKELAPSITLMIIDNIKAQIDKHQNKQLSEMSGKDITESDVVSLRSPVIKRPTLHEGIDTLLLNNEKIKFKRTLGFEAQDIAEQLAYVIMENLVNGGEIFHFDPAYYTGGHNFCWIRY